MPASAIVCMFLYIETVSTSMVEMGYYIRNCLQSLPRMKSLLMFLSCNAIELDVILLFVNSCCS